MTDDSLPMVHPHLFVENARHFWSRVDRSGECWIWTGAVSKGGYGQFVSRPHRFYTHRLSWELHHGLIAKGSCILHDCPGGDNTRCCNPAHMKLGTHAENMADMKMKGRSTPGVRNPASKLTEAQVIACHKMHRQGCSNADIARAMSISTGHVCGILQGKRWPEIALLQKLSA